MGHSLRELTDLAAALPEARRTAWSAVCDADNAWFIARCAAARAVATAARAEAEYAAAMQRYHDLANACDRCGKLSKFCGGECG